MTWQSLSYLYHSKHIVVPHKGALGAAEKVACRIAHYVVRAVLSPERINRGFDKAAMIAKDDPDSDTLMASAYAATEPFPKSMLLPPRIIQFEGKEFFAPADVEGYLRTQYGKTWNQLPPVDQRRNHAPKELYLGE